MRCASDVSVACSSTTATVPSAATRPPRILVPPRSMPIANPTAGTIAARDDRSATTACRRQRSDPGGAPGCGMALPARAGCRSRRARCSVTRRSSSSTRGRGRGDGRGVSHRRSRHQRRMVCGLGGRTDRRQARERGEHDGFSVVVRPALRPRRLGGAPLTGPRVRAGAVPRRRLAHRQHVVDERADGLRVALAAQPEALVGGGQRREEVATTA